MNAILKITKAYDFAASRHIDQRRKGEAAEPYINHLTEVADLVARATQGADPDIVVAAILHDVVEDTPTTIGEVKAAFGAKVAALVAEVTDDKSLAKADRKRLQIEHAGAASAGAKMIKIADKTANLRALATSPPAGWPAARQAEYLAWAKSVVAACRGVDPWLEAHFDAAGGGCGGFAAMKLYQTYASPFPTRVRLLLYVKGLAVEIIEPPGFHASAQSKGDYLQINPIGRVPTLVLDDGRALPESEVICEYLEDAFPHASLRPSDPWARAQVRLVSRICDFYLVMAMRPLFDASGRSRRTWDRGAIDAALGQVETALGYLEAYIGDEGYAVGGSLTSADGALVPQLVLAFEWAPGLFEAPSPLGKHARLAAYWRAIQGDAIASRLIDETRAAIAGEQARARAAARLARGGAS